MKARGKRSCPLIRLGNLSLFAFALFSIRQFYTQALRDEKRLLVNLLIQEIVLYDDKIEIYFNNPTTKSPDDGQGFLFYSGKCKMVIESQNKSPLIIKITIEMYLR